MSYFYRTLLLVALASAPLMTTIAATPMATADVLIAQEDGIVIDPANIQPLTPSIPPQTLEMLNNPAPVSWFSNGKPKETAITAMLDALRKAGEEGLDAADYPVDTLEDQWQRIQQQPGNVAIRSIFDEALVRAAEDYIYHLHYGRFRQVPEERALQALYQPPAIPARQLLANALKTSDMRGALASLAPQHPIYKQLRAEYNRLGEAQDNHFVSLPAGKPLTPGITDPRVPDLAKRMVQEGILSASDPAAAPVNTVYSSTLVEAVRRWQEEQGLKGDGIVGEGTRHVMNASPVQRRRQLVANMERWRWLPRDLGSRYLMVNIPAYTLQAYNDNRMELAMNVIVGRAERETPSFSSTLTGVIFSPAWHVPSTIAVKDKLPLIRRNPDWLTRNNFEVFMNNRKVSPWAVPWRNYNEKYFPVLLRQKPGKHNALGRIRFNLRNSMAIYLHDTAEPGLFSSEMRARSSGCVRVSQPLQLAHFIFDGDPAWPPAKIDALYNAATVAKTRHVELQRETSVHLVYFTVYPNAAGRLVYYPDIYNKDTALLQKMVGQLAKTDY